MYKSTIVAFFLLFLTLLGQSSAFGQADSDSLVQLEPAPLPTIEVDSVLEDTVTILEFPEKAYVTADEVDTTNLIETEKEYSPRKASLYSAILPGLGQAYNEKYWKIPLVYGGVIGFGLVIDFYAERYAYYRRHYLIQMATGTNDTGYNERVLENATTQFRRERDYYIILAGVFYLLNIVDAHIDAHLKGFDVSDDLTLKLEPSFNTTAFNTQVSGLSLTFYIK